MILIKNIKLIYNNKFKTANLVMKNNSSRSMGVLQTTNVIYEFKCPLGDCISENNNIYVSLTPTTLSRRLSMDLSDTSSTGQHLKKHSCPTTEFLKILPKTQQYYSNKITNKNYRFSKLTTLETNIQNSIELILNPVLMYSNVFSCRC